MRILATGDSHLGKGLDLGRQPGDRLAEQEQVWRDTLKLARERRVDAVLHAGDLFDGRRPSPEILLAAERPLVEHQDQGGATVYVIAGNHDVPSQDGPCGLDVLAEAGLIELAREPRSWDLWTDDSQTIVRVHALPWTPVSRLVAANEDAERGDIHALAADLLLQTARELLATPRRKPGPNLLLGHWSVSQTSLPNGLDVGSLGGVVLPMDDLQQLGFDALVFGHIHRSQEVGSFLYTGSPMPLDFGEAAVDHGCWLLEPTPVGGFDTEFVPLESPEFVTVDLRDDEVEALANGTMPALAPAMRRYVRVRYTATEEQARRIDTAALRAHADEYGALRVFIEPTVERARRDRGVQLAEGLAPIDQLAAFLDARGVTANVKPALLARAERHLA